MLLYIKHLFQLIISPGRGWEDIGHADSDPRRLLLNGLLPWLAVVALTSFLPRTVYADIRLFGNKRHNLCIGHIRILFPGILYRTNGHVILHRLIHQCLRHRAQTVNRGSILHRAVGHDSSPRELHAFKPYANAFPAHIRCNNNMEGNPYLEIKTESTGAFMILAILSIIAPPYLLRLALGLLV